MYRELAKYYDTIYHFKNYRKEAERIHGLILRKKKSKGNRFLDVACGTGNHIAFLKQTHTVEGLDSSRDMLQVARRKHPDVVFHYGDMIKFKLDSRYDAITCLFSAIGHLKTKLRMTRAIRNMADHLVPGGVLIVEPWITPDKFRKGIIGANYVDNPTLKIARMNIAKVKGPVSAFEYHYLIGTPKGIYHVVDRESMGLWTHDEYMEAFLTSGLKATYDSKGLTGRGLYIGLKLLA